MKHNHTFRDAVRMAGHLVEHYPTSGIEAVDCDNRACDSTSRRACRWCLHGALYVCSARLGLHTGMRNIKELPSALDWDAATDAQRLQLAREMQQWDGKTWLQIGK